MATKKKTKPREVARLEPVGDLFNLYTKASNHLTRIRTIIDNVESRCMAADGPVTNTRHEMTDKELQQIYILAGGKIHA